jgi:CelD/BcsL family acetyltransferase involved in cellulose biosynthesis
VTSTIALPLRVGARTVGRISRRLVRVTVSLEEALLGQPPQLPPLAGNAHGYLITAMPAAAQGELERRRPELKALVRQRYRRSYASLQGSYDDYLAQFSSKSRSTLKRKVRKATELSGGRLDLRSYSRPDDVELFHGLARQVSAKTYQERLLGAGLPDGDAMIAEMGSLAARGAFRGWLLFLDGKAISYLYAPAEGATLVYAYLGYDPDFADLSPGTVLQFEVMRELMEEKRFAYFDFTGGEGQHKKQFETGSVECVDLLLLRTTLGNMAVGKLLNGFDSGVALAKRGVHALGLQRLARRLRR